jgi:hypothetical protein
MTVGGVARNFSESDFHYPENTGKPAAGLAVAISAAIMVRCRWKFFSL